MKQKLLSLTKDDFEFQTLRIAGMFKSPKEIEKEVERMIEKDLSNGSIKIDYIEN